jgi:hypothetical protein
MQPGMSFGVCCLIAASLKGQSVSSWWIAIDREVCESICRRLHQAGALGLAADRHAAWLKGCLLCIKGSGSGPISRSAAGA